MAAKTFLKATLAILGFLVVMGASATAGGQIIYVDDDAEGANDGSSWADAFNYLQDALAAAWSGDEIRVAHGIYKPDQGDGQTPGDRYATFQLINGVTIKGGYAGFGEPDPNVRDIGMYETILSGDLNGDDIEIINPQDLEHEPSRAENSYHVLTGIRINETAVLDGFTITAGNANGAGGMWISQSTPTLNNCILNRNYRCALGSYDDSSPKLTNCMFIANQNGMESGLGGNPTLTNCIFSGNIWAAFFDKSDPTMINCTFSGNYLAIETDGDSIATLTNCIIWGNEMLIFEHGYEIINYCCIQDSIDTSGGTGNIDADPCFVEPGYWKDPCGTPDFRWDDVWVEGDYHLLPGSPCVDAGDPNYVTGPNETDLDGNPRVIGGRIDMGAYEYSPPIQADLRIVPRTINLASSGKWIAAFIRLPEQYNVADIDPNIIFLEGEIEADTVKVDVERQVVIAKFSRESVQSILEVGEFELTITGRLKDGTFFEATDIVQVTDKGGGKSAK